MNAATSGGTSAASLVGTDPRATSARSMVPPVSEPGGQRDGSAHRRPNARSSPGAAGGGGHGVDRAGQVGGLRVEGVVQVDDGAERGGPAQAGVTVTTSPGPPAVGVVRLDQRQQLVGGGSASRAATWTPVSPAP